MGRSGDQADRDDRGCRAASRYLECIRIDPAKAACRGILAAQKLKPQAVALATARGIACVEVDLDFLRGLRKPELTLFS